MKRFNRGDFVRVGETKTFGVVVEVAEENGHIVYMVLNINGEYVKKNKEDIHEIHRVRHG
jgi:hypothetical protein